MAYHLGVSRGFDPVEELITLAYDAAVQPEAWDVFLKNYAAEFRGDSVVLAAHDERSGSIAFSHGVDPDAQRSYNSYYHSVNAYLKHGLHNFKSGRVIPGEQMCPDRQLLSSEFYNDYLKRFDIRFALGLCLEHGWGRGSHLGVCRSHRRKAFSTQDAALASALSPHITRALKLYQRVSGFEQRLKTLSSCLDTVAFASLLVDRRGKIQEASAKAIDLCSKGDGMRIRQGVLSAATPADDSLLRANIASCFDAAIGSPDKPAAALQIHRLASAEPWRATFYPIRTVTREGVTRPLCLIFIQDPSVRSTPASSLVRQWFGLTPMEAQVATLLASGLSVEQIAENLVVKIDTVRSHLRRIFMKTGATSQAKLVAALYQLPR